MDRLTDLLAAIGTSLVVTQATDLVPVLSVRIVRWSAGRLGPEADRYREQWLADLREMPGKLAMFGFAGGCITASFRLLPPVPLEREKFRPFLKVLLAFWGLRVLLAIQGRQLDAKYRDAPTPEPKPDGSPRELPDDFDQFMSAVVAMSVCRAALDQLRSPPHDLDPS